MRHKIDKIVIDPGHGKDARPYYSDGACETDIAWNTARKLKKLLEAKGHEVLLTKKTRDALPGPSARGRLSANCSADVFVSLHCNAEPDNPYKRGVYGIFYGLDSSETTAPDEEICAPNSRRLARFIAQEIATMTGIPLRGEEGARVSARCPSNPGVLTGGKNWKRTNAACLIEAGFLSNEEDRKILREDKAQYQYALACARGIYRFAEKEIPEDWDIATADTDSAPNRTLAEINAEALKQATLWTKNQGATVPDVLETPISTSDMLIIMHDLLKHSHDKRPD